MKERFKEFFMEMAKRTSWLSRATRLKVGAVIVKDDRIISIGYNGMPAGWDNTCEIDGVTRPEVLHAETNAIAKLAKSTESGKDATMFVTCAPCLDCAKLIYQSGITEVYYAEDYRSDEGVKFLNKCDGIIAWKMNDRQTN
jgi:dCMP deaminase